MARTVLMGDPAYFRIRSGYNPYTRDRWGRRKRVDQRRARAQWERLRGLLENHGVDVKVVPPAPEQPGLCFPANAGVRLGDHFYLSNLHPGRAGEREHYRRAISSLGLTVRDLPAPHPFEGEADFIRVQGAGGDPTRPLYLFTWGPVRPPRLQLRLGWPPVAWRFGFRSDVRMRGVLEELVKPAEVIPLELTDPAHYHGDTVLCPFGPGVTLLIAYLEGLSHASVNTLRYRFGDRLLDLGRADGRQFAANSFPLRVEREGGAVELLVMPDGLSIGLYAEIRRRGVIPVPVDVSEFLEKGGGAVKCLLLDLGEL